MSVWFDLRHPWELGCPCFRGGSTGFPTSTQGQALPSSLPSFHLTGTINNRGSQCSQLRTKLKVCLQFPATPAPDHSFSLSQCLFVLYLAWRFLHSTIEKSRLLVSQLQDCPGLSQLARVPATRARTGIKLLKVYTRAVLIFTYK